MAMENTKPRSRPRKDWANLTLRCFMTLRVSWPPAYSSGLGQCQFPLVRGTVGHLTKLGGVATLTPVKDGLTLVGKGAGPRLAECDTQ